jgi:hypothetical protein
MNRRGFLAFLAATPLAGLLGLKPRLPTATAAMAPYLEAREKRTRGPTMTPAEWSKTVGSIDYENMTELMSDLAEEAGKSHAQIKAELASTSFKDAFWK